MHIIITELNSNLTPTLENIFTAESGYSIGINYQYRSGKHYWGFLEIIADSTIPAGSSTKTATASVTPTAGNKFFVAFASRGRWNTDFVVCSSYLGDADGGLYINTPTAKARAKVWYDFMSQ